MQGGHGLSEKWSRSEFIWHWLTFTVVLLTVPAFYLELAATDEQLRWFGTSLYAFVSLFFAVRLVVALIEARSTRDFLGKQWLDALIFVGAVGNLLGSYGGWSMIEWTLRTLYVLIVMVRIVTSLRNLFSTSGAVFSIGLIAILLGLSGAGFYWLEPTVTSYADALWLAFVSGSSVGYGDLVPTTIPSRIFASFVVIVGYGVMSIVTASLVAIFVGRDEDALRREMHRDIKALREEIAMLRNEIHALSRKDTSPTRKK
ncbi:MAG TPA: ion channel [Burkholderiales bacterium]|nr:ion channel [Burkholderiales bacterium]